MKSRSNKTILDKLTNFFIVLIFTIVGTPALGQMQMMPDNAEGALAQKAALQFELMAKWAEMDDIEGSGPFPATYDMAPNRLEYVVYHPKGLVEASKVKKLGVYIWGNGGCSPDGATARFHLSEIASRGFIAIATGKILSGPKALEDPNVEPESSFGMGANTEKMIAALDWILSENDREGSPYYQTIDIDRIAVGGNSCGGLIALKASLDPRFKALVVQNSGTMKSEGGGFQMPGMLKEELEELQLPVLYITGGPEDVAQPNAMDDFEKINHVPVFIADHPGAGHVGLFLEPNGEATKIEIDWLLWQLDGDEIASETFVGENCELCHDFRWIVYRKGELYNAE